MDCQGTVSIVMVQCLVTGCSLGCQGAVWIVRVYASVINYQAEHGFPQIYKYVSEV